MCACGSSFAIVGSWSLYEPTGVHYLCLQEFIKDGKRTGNIVFAPISLSVGLGVLYLGAKGSSRDEIAKVSRRVILIIYHIKY